MALRIAPAGRSSSSNWLTVGASGDRSCNAPACAATAIGPTSGIQMRPTRVARCTSWGRVSCSDSAMPVLVADLEPVALEAQHRRLEPDFLQQQVGGKLLVLAIQPAVEDQRPVGGRAR